MTTKTDPIALYRWQPWIYQ